MDSGKNSFHGTAGFTAAGIQNGEKRSLAISDDGWKQTDIIAIGERPDHTAS